MLHLTTLAAVAGHESLQLLAHLISELAYKGFSQVILYWVRYARPCM